ncbi:MAG: hypothetical protein J0M26_20505, partial [Planctomycetes bacterium]|nr:hypothetical protein [Planctomycetota bacterium]
MTVTTAARNKVQDSKQQSVVPETFLSCFEISNSDGLTWSVRLYKVRANSGEKTHAERGEFKQVIWSLKKKHQELCSGYGFVVDLDEETIAVPSTWQLPSDVHEGGYHVILDSEFTTDPTNSGHQSIISGILREGIKKHFKENRSDVLGELWQDFDQFCQMPPTESVADNHFCRKFGIAAKMLVGKRWVIQPLITTATVDGRTFADYCRNGELSILAEMIEAKQANRLNRRNRATAVRVLRDESTEFLTRARVLELEEPNLLVGIAKLSGREQAEKAGGTIKCRSFNGPAVDVPLHQLRLILDSQITQADHSETILEPADRHHFAGLLRDFVNGVKVNNIQINLSESPLDASALGAEKVAFPALRVRGEGTAELVLPSPIPVTREALRNRGRQRTEALKRFGYLQSNPINPLLAWPKRFGQDRAKRMATDINYLMKIAGIGFQFQWFLYENVDELGRYITSRGFDSLFAVLPEGSRKPYRDDSTHEKIKQRIDVPSQCIQFDHTLPEKWVNKPHREMEKEDARLARRIKQRYELCLWNLLAKLHWIPFAPLDPFNYNVHIGLDVGGRHNTHIMACLGHGFASPKDGLLFRPEEIAIDVQKAEPIPTECLTRGLLQLIEQVHSELTAAKVTPDFESLLLFRDGRLLGDGDEWNEIDAIRTVFKQLHERGWVTEKAIWTAVEVMKSAEGWRIMNGIDGVAHFSHLHGNVQKVLPDLPAVSLVFERLLVAVESL